MQDQMTEDEFNHYAQQGYNRIPITREILADLDTPLSAYVKLADQPYSYLFESVHGGEQWGRYSIIGLPCKTQIKIFEYTVRIEEQGQLKEEHTVENPLRWIETFKEQFNVPDIPGLPRFHGGLSATLAMKPLAILNPN